MRVCAQIVQLRRELAKLSLRNSSTIMRNNWRMPEAFSVDHGPRARRHGARSNVLPGIATLLVLEGMVGLQLVLAHRDHFLTVAEMQGRGVSEGLPLLWHGGIWGDILIVSPLAGIVCAMYGSRWRATEIVICAVASASATATMACIWSYGDLPEAHRHSGQLTAAGMVHLAYMFAALTILALFYFCSGALPLPLVGIVSGLLILHTIFGTHLWLGPLKAAGELAWYPRQPLTDPLSWGTVFGVALFAVWRIVSTR